MGQLNDTMYDKLSAVYSGKSLGDLLSQFWADHGAYAKFGDDLWAFYGGSNSTLTDRAFDFWTNFNTQRAVGGLAFWLDANQIVGKNDNDAMANWPDLGPLAGLPAQGTGSAQPHYKATGATGSKPAVNFDGGDSLDQAWVADVNTTQFYAYAVIKPAATSAGTYLSTRAISPKRGYAVDAANTFRIIAGDGGLNFNTTGTRSVTANTLTCVAFGYDGANITIQVGNQAVETRAQIYVPNPTNPLRVGANTPEGAPSLWYNGNIAEILMFNHYLTTAEQTSMKNYLGTKYGLTL